MASALLDVFDLIAHDALGPAFHQVAHAGVGVSEHDVAAGARRLAFRLEFRRIDPEVGEPLFLLEQQVAPRDEQDLLGGQPSRQEDEPTPSGGHRLVRRGFLARNDRTLEMGLDGLHLEPQKSDRVDPDPAAVARLREIARVEGDDVAESLADRVRALEPVPVVGVSRKSRGSDSTFSACSSGSPGRSGPHFVPLTEKESSSHSTVSGPEKNRFSVITSKTCAAVGRKCSSTRSEAMNALNAFALAVCARWCCATISSTLSERAALTSVRLTNAFVAP